MSGRGRDDEHNGGGGVWRFARGRILPLDRARLVAIINVTPDSFSDGGEHLDPAAAAARALRAVEEGADALDIGGESTRPGAAAVSAAEQIARVVPAIHAIRAAGVSVPITIDTTLAPVAAAALDAGADAINDTSAGRDDGAMFTLAAARACGLVLMHRLRRPAADRYSTAYAPGEAPDYAREGGVVKVVGAFLRSRAAAAEAAGVPRGAIVLDPGFGFGKTPEDLRTLLRAAPELLKLGYPLMCGVSRKSFLAVGDQGSPPGARAAASVEAALVQWRGGVRLFRVHDVAAHAAAMREARPEQR